MKEVGSKTLGFGCPDTTDPHRFELDIPAARALPVTISEHYGIAAGIGGQPEVAERCELPRLLWTLIAEDVKRDFNDRLRARKLTAGRWTVGVNKLERLLGKELLVLAWAIEKAAEADVPNAIRNWIGLRPEERWWLYTATAAATGYPDQSEIGWRKALRFALTENPLAEDLAGRVPLKKAPARISRKKPGMGESLLLFATENEESSPFLNGDPR